MIPQHESALLISDLHLTPSMPLTAQRFFDFCEKEGPSVKAVFILGDLFEYWIGDDAALDSPFQQEVKRTIANLSTKVKTYYVHGNRDFLVGADYLKKTGMTLLSDPSKIVIAGHEYIISHGEIILLERWPFQLHHLPWRLAMHRRCWLSNLSQLGSQALGTETIPKNALGLAQIYRQKSS